MARPRYQIAEKDIPVVHRWVHTKCRNTAWPQPNTAHTARNQFPHATPTAEQLQQWCDRFLEATQWTQLQAVIRAARREASQTRTVRLSPSAYTRLHDLAVREQLTLSETIDRYLADVTAPPIHSPTPPPAEKTPKSHTAARTSAREKARPVVAPQKRSRAFVTTKKGVCYLTVKIGREHCALMRIYHYTIDAQDKRDMRRLHPDVDFDWKKITRQLAEKREVCRHYRSRRRTARVPREREPFYGVFNPAERTAYVNDPTNIAGMGAMLDAIIAGRH
jgi:hypothetical protein